MSRQRTMNTTASIRRSLRCIHPNQEQETSARKHRRSGVKWAPHLISVSECK